METHQALLTVNWNLLFSLITLVVLVLVLKKFFFEKVRKFMQERREDLEGQFARAEEENRKAEEKSALYEQKIAGAEEERLQILNQATEDAKKKADLLLADAREEARKIKERTEQEIALEEEEAKRHLARDVTRLAALAAGQILEREIRPEDHQDCVDKTMKKAEETVWKAS